MAFINELRISGRAAGDAARKGNGPVRFALIQGGGKKQDSEERWPTEYFNVAAWPQTCETAATVGKGDFVTITGRLKQYEFKDSNGDMKRGYEIVAKTVEVSKPQKPITPNLHGILASNDDISF